MTFFIFQRKQKMPGYSILPPVLCVSPRLFGLPFSRSSAKSTADLEALKNLKNKL